MGKGKVPLSAINKIRAAEDKKRLVREPGTFTAPEYAEEAQLSDSRARRILRALVESGDLILCKIPVRMISGSITHRPGYRLAKHVHGEK